LSITSKKLEYGIAIVKELLEISPLILCHTPRSIIPATGSRRILQESHRILQENTENIWNIEAVFPPGIFRIFSNDFRRILSESTGSCRNPLEKIREVSDRNTSSNFLVFSVGNRPFPAVCHSPGYVIYFVSAEKAKILDCII
jgi:hypothetical protein